MTFAYLVSKVLKKARGSSIFNSCIHKTSKVESGSNIVNTTIARHSFCGYGCEIINAEIGAFCSIANNVIVGGGMHPMNWVAMSPVFYKGRDSVKAKFSEHEREPVKTTIIGHDVWIGNNAMIKQGVTIGNGAVVGMGSIVTKNVDPYMIVAGNPAKGIRKRFDDIVIADLIEIQWWNFTDTQLNKFASSFTDPKQFISLFKNQ